jgi:hypothetical protein
MKLKSPTELVIEPRISGGLVCAVAKTLDDGAASVIWDVDAKSWVFAKGLSVGTVFAADVAPATVLMAKDIPSLNISPSETEVKKLIIE